MAQAEIGIKLRLDGAQQVDGDLRNVAASIEKLNGAVAHIAHYGAALAFLPDIFNGTVGGMVRMADSVTALQTQLRLATGSIADAGRAYNQLFEIAQRSRVGFLELGGTFASISRAGAELGLSQDRLLKVTEAIGNAMAVSGGAAQGMQAALTQLSQGLASGVLRGEELNSVMEQSPRLARALADGMGVGIGKLRELGAAGQLTAQQVIAALESQSKVLQNEVAGSVMTVSQAFTQLQNSTIKTVGDFDKAAGASVTLAGAISSMAGAVDGLGAAFTRHENAIKTVMGAIGGVAVVAGLARLPAAIGAVTAAVGTLGAVLAANPVTMVLLGLGAATGAAMTAVETRKNSLEGLAAEIERTSQRIATAEGQLNSTTARGEFTRQLEERIRAMRKYRNELQQTYSEKATPIELDTRAEDARLLAVAAGIKQAEKNAESLNALRLKMDAVPADYLKDMQEIIRLNQAGVLTGKDYLDMLDQMQGKLLKNKDATKAAITEQQKLAETGLKVYDDLMARAGGLNPDFSEKWNSLNAAYAAGKIKVEQLITAQRALLQVQEFASDAAKENTKAVDELFEAQEKLRLTNEGQIKTARTTLEQIAFETELLGLNTEQRALANMERELERQGIVKGTQAYEAYIQKLRDAVAIKGVKESNVKAADEAARAWEKMADDINRAITDSLFRAAEDGKDIFLSLRDTITAAFKTMVLRPVVSAIVSPVAGAALGAFGLPAAATTASSVAGGSGMGMLGNASSFMNIGTSLAGIGNGLSAWGAGGSVSGVFSNPALYTGAELLGAALPIIGAALLVASIFGEKNWETKYGGIYQQDDGASGNILKLSGPGTGGDFPEQYTQKLIQQTSAGIDKFFERMGSSTRVAMYTAGAESSGQGEAFAAAGGRLSTGATFGEFERIWRFNRGNATPEEAMKNLAREVKQSLLQAIVADDSVPASIKKIMQDVNGDMIDLNKITAEQADQFVATINQLVTGVELLQIGLQDLPFANLKALSFDAAAGLAEFSGGLSQFTANLDSYFSNFFSAEEQRAAKVRQITRVLSDAGFTFTTEQVGKATREQFRAVAEGLNTSTEAGQKMYAALISVAGAFADITPAAQTAAQSVRETASALLDPLQTARAGTDAALASVQRAVQAQRQQAELTQQLAQEQVDATRAVFDTLKSNVRDLYAEVDSTRSSSAAEGRQVISEALRTALATGYLPDQGDLADAISAVRGDLAKTVYASKFEEDRARLLLAGELEQLKRVSGTQLTAAEQQLQVAKDQLTALDQVLAQASAQVDALRGIDTSVLSVVDALQQLATAIAQERTLGTAGAAALAGGAAAAGSSTQPRPVISTNVINGVAAGFAPSEVFSLAQADANLTGTDVGHVLYNTAKQMGASMADVDTYFGWTPGTSEDWARSNGLPTFAVGANRLPQDMLALVHKNEAIIPAPFNPWAGGSMPGAADPALLEEVKALRAELVALRRQMDTANLLAGRTAEAVNGRGEAPILMEVAQ